MLDTSVIIDFDPIAVAKHAETVAISSISLAELAYGLHMGNPVQDARRQARYHLISHEYDVIDFNPAAALVYGALVAKTRDAGRDPRPRRFDLLLAAVAVSQNLPLITRNPKDFIGLQPPLTILAM
ncbi:MAG: PIN domain-containing protein [Mycobacteriales bacterium]